MGTSLAIVWQSKLFISGDYHKFSTLSAADTAEKYVVRIRHKQIYVGRIGFMKDVASVVRNRVFFYFFCWI
jgi:hypothetical protein